MQCPRPSAASQRSTPIGYEHGGRATRTSAALTPQSTRDIQARAQGVDPMMLQIADLFSSPPVDSGSEPGVIPA